jgi:hypothetical protein
LKSPLKKVIGKRDASLSRTAIKKITIYYALFFEDEPVAVVRIDGEYLALSKVAIVPRF